jgi:hypothetical protein
MTADDFTVVIKDLPRNKAPNLNELKANLWIWAENILQFDVFDTKANLNPVFDKN